MALSAHFFYWVISFVFKNYEISHEFDIQWNRHIWATYLFVILYMWFYELGKLEISRLWNGPEKVLKGHTLEEVKAKEE